MYVSGRCAGERKRRVAALTARLEALEQELSVGRRVGVLRDDLIDVVETKAVVVVVSALLDWLRAADVARSLVVKIRECAEVADGEAQARGALRDVAQERILLQQLRAHAVRAKRDAVDVGEELAVREEGDDIVEHLEGGDVEAGRIDRVAAILPFVCVPDEQI